MNQFIQSIIESDENIILLHNDAYPYKHERVINLGLSEFLTIQYAHGLTLQGYKVLIYSISPYMLNKISYFSNDYNLHDISFLSLQSMYVYHNDVYMARQNKMKVYAPYDKDQTRELITKNHDFKYIRMIVEDSIELTNNNTKINLRFPVLTYGWLYTYLSKIVQPILPIIDLNTKIPYKGIVVEDHIRLSGLSDFVNTIYWIGIEHDTQITKDQFVKYVLTQLRKLQ
ncbi:MAG: hypothetical protein QXH07_03190 [Thermoplasmata archaeon]